jgi:hypothetical protein
MVRITNLLELYRIMKQKGSLTNPFSLYNSKNTYSDQFRLSNDDLDETIKG